MSNESSINYECTLTTFDNPYDPFTDFKQWFLFDTEKGYGTSSYLARMVNIPDDASEAEERAEIERAIDRIIELDFMNIYKKVKREVKVDEENE